LAAYIFFFFTSSLVRNARLGDDIMLSVLFSIGMEKRSLSSGPQTCDVMARSNRVDQIWLSNESRPENRLLNSKVVFFSKASTYAKFKPLTS